MRFSASIYLERAQISAQVTAFRFNEALSCPFDGWAVFVLDAQDLSIDGLLWTGAYVTLMDDVTGRTRVFHAVIEEARYLFIREHRHFYRVRLRPQINGLGYRIRSRIFQDQSAIDVVQCVLSEAGIPEDSLSWGLTGKYPNRLYTTQYKESELAFVSRLLEEEGVYYWFEHSSTGHVQCFRDDASAHLPIEGGGVLPFSSRADSEEDHIWDLVFTTRVASDAHSTRDWNWERPTKPIKAEQKDSAGGMLERYEYPGGFYTESLGSRLALDRLHAQLVDRFEIRGRSNGWTLAPGGLIAIPGARPACIEGEWLLLEVEHRFEQNTVAEGAGQGTSPYTTSFRAMARDLPYRPPRRTPRPKIFGTETATVMGPAGEEIHVDESGRVRVLFYWDREGNSDDTASCWIRVQQINNAGSMILPRVGWELTIRFLDGDPDRPVALQKLYNKSTMPPYELPANKTQGSLQSSSSPGGGGTNEIRAQDSGGAMELFVHAQKDHSIRANNNASEEVTVDAAEEIGKSLTTSVKANEEESVGANHSLTIVDAATCDTKGARTTSVGVNDTWGITKNFSITVDGSRTHTIGAAQIVVASKIGDEVKGSLTRTVGAAHVAIALESIVEAVGGTKKELVGGAKIHLTPKALAENVGAAKALNSGAMLWKTSGDLGLGAKAAMSFAIAGPFKSSVTEAFSLGSKRVIFNAGAMATLAGASSAMKLSGGSVTFDTKALQIAGSAQVELKCPVKYKKKKGKGKGKKGSGGSGGAGAGGAGAGGKGKGKGGSKGKNKSAAQKKGKYCPTPGGPGSPPPTMNDLSPAQKNALLTDPKTATAADHALNSSVGTKGAPRAFWSGEGKDRVDEARAANPSLHPRLEGTTAGAGLEGQKTTLDAMPWQDASLPQGSSARDYWTTASQRFAQEAGGSVDAYVVGTARPGNVFRSIELPTLLHNPNVNKINFLTGTKPPTSAGSWKKGKDGCWTGPDIPAAGGNPGFQLTAGGATHN